MKKKTAVSAAGCLCLLLVLCEGARLSGKIGRQDPMDPVQAAAAPEMQIQEKGNIVNIALFGMDHDQGKGDEEMDRSDGVKILSVNTDTGAIRILSLQRDTLVWIPDPVNDFSKWNHACWEGGPELGVRTLNMNLDLDITRWAAVSFAALETVTDAVGGIDIPLNEKEAHILGLPAEGIHHLGGREALVYCRIRMIDDDFCRMERQNTVMKALLEKVSELPLLQRKEVIESVLPYIETDLSDREILSLVSLLVRSDPAGFETESLPSGGMDDVAEAVSRHGVSTLYRLKDPEAMIRKTHLFLYGEEDHVLSEQASAILEHMEEVFPLR